MPKSKTLVTILLDRSGSMMSAKSDTIGAINSYVETLQTSGEDIRFSLVQFDSDYNGVMRLLKTHVGTPIGVVPELTAADYTPQGGTPLIDAACATIHAISNSLSGKKASSTKVVVAIQTDGQELHSKENGWDDLKALILEKEEAGWEFIFMGCGIDAYTQGSQMGIKAGKTISYGKNDAQTRAAFAATAQNTALYASGMASTTEYSAVQKRSAGDMS